MPIVDILFGMEALTFISGFLETAGVIAMLAAIIFFSIHFGEAEKYLYVTLTAPVKTSKPGCQTSCAASNITDSG